MHTKMINCNFKEIGKIYAFFQLNVLIVKGNVFSKLCFLERPCECKAAVSLVFGLLLVWNV